MCYISIGIYSDYIHSWSNFYVDIVLFIIGLPSFNTRTRWGYLIHANGGMNVG